MPRKAKIDATTSDVIDSPQVTIETAENGATVANTPALQALLDSGIIEIVDGAIVWRNGHLEHVRNQYASDPLTCERNYADDIAVMRENGVEL